MPYSPNLDPAAWNRIVIGGNVWPGSWHVATGGEMRDVKTSKAQGKDGHTMRDKGMRGADFVLTGTFDDLGFADMARLLPSVTPRRPGGVRTPLSIIHPIPNIIGVTEIYIAKIQPVQPKGAKGFFRLKIAAMQWFAQAKKVAESVKSDSAAGADERDQMAATALDLHQRRYGDNPSGYPTPEEMNPGPTGQDFIEGFEPELEGFTG